MKRVSPQTDYDGDQGYPDVAPAELSRRRFLLAGVSSAAAVGAALWGPDQGQARQRRRRGSGYYAYVACRIGVSGCDHQIRGVGVTTHSKVLAAFLRLAKERVAIRAVVRAELTGISCKDLATDQRRARYEKRVARALGKHYRKRTGKRVSTPTVRLAVWQDPGNPGFPARASFP